MIETFNVLQDSSGCISIYYDLVKIFADRIMIGKASTWVGTVVELVDESGRVNAILPIQLFTDEAIEKIKSFTNTEVIEDADIKEKNTEEPNTEETDIDEWSIEAVRKKLKPCPFCGGKGLNLIYLDEEGYLLEHYGELAEYACIECDGCNLMMREQIIDNDDTKALFKRWNRRA